MTIWNELTTSRAAHGASLRPQNRETVGRLEGEDPTLRERPSAVQYGHVTLIL